MLLCRLCGYIWEYTWLIIGIISTEWSEQWISININLKQNKNSFNSNKKVCFPCEDWDQKLPSVKPLTLYGTLCSSFTYIKSLLFGLAIILTSDYSSIWVVWYSVCINTTVFFFVHLYHWNDFFPRLYEQMYIASDFYSVSFNISSRSEN